MTQGLLAGRCQLNAIALIIVRYVRSTIKVSAIPVGASRALTSRLLRHSAHFGDRCDGTVVGHCRRSHIAIVIGNSVAGFQ